MTIAADSTGKLRAKFTIPPNTTAGNKSLTVIGAGGQTAESIFSGQGTIQRQAWQQNTTVTTVNWVSPPPPTPVREGGGHDPLAQTFTLTSNRQISGLDLWFTAKGTTEVQIQIRTTASGFPDATILATARHQPADITIDGTATRFTFEAPVMLQDNVEYAVVVMCNDAVSAVGVAELGKFDSVAQKWVTSQPYTVGVLLSSSNATTWTAHQDKDLAFRLLNATFTQNARTIDLGKVAVADATDLMLMSYAEQPSSVTGVDYTLTLPDASTITVSDGQAIQLPAAITGNVHVAANLRGNTDFAPVLSKGAQLASGIVSASADYVSRAVPGGAGVTVKVIFEANIPSGAGVAVKYKDSAGSTWTTIGSPTTAPADDGFAEFTYVATGITAQAIQAKLTLTGTSAARPRVRDLRVIVL